MSQKSGINRNIVECKDRCPLNAHSSLLVLIETLWNVKEIPQNTGIHAVSCINRNIVECKELA